MEWDWRRGYWICMLGRDREQETRDKRDCMWWSSLICPARPRIDGDERGGEIQYCIPDLALFPAGFAAGESGTTSSHAVSVVDGGWWVVGPPGGHYCTAQHSTALHCTDCTSTARAAAERGLHRWFGGAGVGESKETGPHPHPHPHPQQREGIARGSTRSLPRREK